MMRIITRCLEQLGIPNNKFSPLMLAVALLVILSPMLEAQGLAGVFFTVLTTSTIMAGIYSLHPESRLLYLTLFAASFALFADIVEYIRGEQSQVLAYVLLVYYTLFFCIFTIWVIAKVVSSKIVDREVIYGSIAGYLLIGISGGTISAMIELIWPNSFNLPETGVTFQSFIYYSFVTLSTVGFGDVTPISPQAQSFSIVLGIIGQLYLAILVAALVGAYLNTIDR